MKERLLTALEALLLSCAITAGPMAALAYVYALPLSWGIPAICWALSFLAGLLILPRRRGGTVALGTVCFCIGFFLWRPEPRSQLLTLLELISKQLNGVYHLGYLEFPDHAVGTVELPVALWGSCLVLAVSRSVLRRKSSALPLFLSIPPLLLCALLTQFPPEAWTVFLWLGGILVLLLSSGSRKTSPRQGMTLSAMALVPVCLLCGLLYLTIPQDGYQDHALALRQRCMQFFESRGSTAAPVSIPAPELQRTVDLATLNGANQPSLPVLIVTAPISGDLYLRGQSYDRYTGTGWEMSSDGLDSFDGWGESQGDVQIRTFALQSVLYLPYYPGTGTVLSGGALKNTGSVLSYSFPKYPYGSAASSQTLEESLTLPDSTRAWAEGYRFFGTTREIAQAIGDLVRESADYDKATGAMPEGQDFARWFLENSETGYCVHFATAATVLLRSAGIPARYVTGFRCEATAGQPLVVTTEEAHAWAEYYDSDLGFWQILEATASGSTRPIPAETLPTEATPQPAPTQAHPQAPTVSQSEPPEARHSEKSGSGLSWLWLLILIPVLLPLRRLTVLYLRRQRAQRANLNRRCLLLWTNAECLSRALGAPPPEALHALAERARYSQHRLTPMELRPLEDYLRECREKLEEKPPLVRFWNKYILLLY